MEASADTSEQPPRKRVRRNALRPNSVECDALREFGLLHTFAKKTELEHGDTERTHTDEQITKESEGADGPEVAAPERPETEVEEIIATQDPPKPPDNADILDQNSMVANQQQ